MKFHRAVLCVLGLATVLPLFVGQVGQARGQEGGPSTDPATAARPDPAEIVKLDECRELARTSKRLRGQVMNDLRPEIQQADADMTMRNKKHVVMAYAALWILAVGFLVLLFLRQQRLLGEISRLEREVRAAAGDDDDDEKE